MMTRLRTRLGEQRYRRVMATVTDNLEAYARARDADLTDAEWAGVLRLPSGELDEESVRLLRAMLDHALRQVIRSR